MAINEADLVDYIQRTEKTITDLQRDVRRLTKNEGRWENTYSLHPKSTNLSNIREMFLLEIIREKGLLDELDLDAIAEKVKTALAGDRVPWGAGQKTALNNLRQALEETKGNYDWTPEADRRSE